MVKHQKLESRHVMDDVPRMLLWILWKERNICIFKDKKSSKEEVWKRLVHNLQKTIRRKKWGERDKDLTKAKARITTGWGIGRKDLDGLRQKKTRSISHPAQTFGLLRNQDLSSLTLTEHKEKSRSY